MASHRPTTAEIVEHAARRASARGGGADVGAALDALSGHDFTTILLASLRARARARRWRDVLEHALRAPSMLASSADARAQNALDRLLYDAAAEFDAVDLAPVVPSGASSCAGVDPNNVLGAVRFAEVAADPGVGLALHAARAREGDIARAARLRLCASHRVLRMQPLTNPAFTPHFRLFALAACERAPARRDDRAVERALLLEQLEAWARAFAAMERAGYRVTRLRVVLADTRVVKACLRSRGVDPDALARGAKAHEPGSSEARLAEAGVDLPRAAREIERALAVIGVGREAVEIASALEREVAAPLRARYPAVDVLHDTARIQGLHYYDGPMVQLHVTRDDGLELPVGDGGAVAWVREMRSDARERFALTGIGAELIVKLFRREPAGGGK